jgi:hypothetical protein
MQEVAAQRPAPHSLALAGLSEKYNSINSLRALDGSVKRTFDNPAEL